MKGFVAAVLLLGVLSLVQAQNRPVQLCTGGGAGASFVNEGAYLDFISTAPSGFRVSIHTIGYVPADSATFTTDSFFMAGSGVGFEAIRWPWILHFEETVFVTNGNFHDFHPIPIVVGEQPVGYLLVVDEIHDIFFGQATSNISDGILTVDPGLVVAERPLFDASSFYGPIASPRACFTYTLDQFGGLAVVAGGHRLTGFDGSEQLLTGLYEGVYSLISHRALSVSGRMCSSRTGSSVMCEAGMVLADGHRFVVESQSAAGMPVLEVHLPTGESERLALDETFGTSVRPLPIEIVGDDAADFPSQLFASAFSNNDEALQDAAIAMHMSVGDLDHLDLAATRITARVLLTTSAYDVTLVALETDGESSLHLFSHRHVFAGASEGTTTSAVSRWADSHGLLGSTSADAATRVELPLDVFLLERDSVISTEFAHSRFL